MKQDSDPLRPRPTQDKRGFFMLPQTPTDSGYYGVYDQDGTRRLIHFFRIFAPVVTVIFNDPGIPYCAKASRHDNHFHLNLRG